MKLRYYPETDSLYIELMQKPGTATYEIREGLNADVDADGNVVGFDIEHLATLLADAGPGAKREGWRISRFTDDADYADEQVIGGYARVFDEAVIGRGIHHYIGALPGIANADLPGQHPGAVSLIFDDTAPMPGAERNV